LYRDALSGWQILANFSANFATGAEIVSENGRKKWKSKCWIFFCVEVSHNGALFIV
jgi:hypothetical protein